MWEESQVLFVTLNMPGSLNDGLLWSRGSSNPSNEGARLQEVIERTRRRGHPLARPRVRAGGGGRRKAALHRFASRYAGIPAAIGGDGLDGYTAFVKKLADLATHFLTIIWSYPVIGDSHLFEADRPLADPKGPTGKIHQTQAVPNLTAHYRARLG